METYQQPGFAYDNICKTLTVFQRSVWFCSEDEFPAGPAIYPARDWLQPRHKAGGSVTTRSGQPFI